MPPESVPEAKGFPAVRKVKSENVADKKIPEDLQKGGMQVFGVESVGETPTQF